MKIEDIDRLIGRAEIINEEYGKVPWSFHQFLDYSLKELLVRMPIEATALSDRLNALTVSAKQWDEYCHVQEQGNGWAD